MKLVMIVDDSNVIRKNYKYHLEKYGINCIEAENGKDALNILLKKSKEIYTIILDQEMPIMNGFEFLKKVKEINGIRDIPVIFSSSINENKFIKETLSYGVFDYLLKPVDYDIFLLKIRNAINYFTKEKELESFNNYILKKNEELKAFAQEKSQEVDKISQSLLEILVNTNFYNDNDTGFHIQRVASYAEFIGLKIGLEPNIVKQIKKFAPLHDLGKIGISESILKKPDKLTFEEFEIIKTHVTIGYNIIKHSVLPSIAKNIVLYHHEKWNGKGYVHELSGEDIPIEARIIALADVFDALANRRVYKEEFPKEQVLEILISEKGNSFQPQLVDIIIENIDVFYKIKNSLIEK